jgi:DUF1365 family protein
LPPDRQEACLYVGRIVHRRATPVRHEFGYRIALLGFELGREQALERLAPWFGVGRRAPVSWWRSDHFGDPAQPLDDAVRDLVAQRTGERPRGAIRLLTGPRVLGYGFNPISFFFCHDASGDVEAMVAEVTSTPWAERHCYVLPVPAIWRSRTVQRFVTPKRLHVSPFLGMQYDYRWRVGLEDDRFSVGISAGSDREKPFAAAMSLVRAPLRRTSLARFLVSPPLGGAGTMAAIHFEALRLWWKGAPVHPHPAVAAADHPSETGRRAAAGCPFAREEDHDRARAA